MINNNTYHNYNNMDNQHNIVNRCNVCILDLACEIQYMICEHLCIVDRMSLKFTCWELNQLIDKELMDLEPFIRERIKDFIQPDEFLNLLEYEVISGSFIVACLYNTWDFDDIDIYARKSTLNSIQREVYTSDLMLHAARDERHLICREMYQEIEQRPEINDTLKEILIDDLPQFNGIQSVVRRYSPMTKFLYKHFWASNGPTPGAIETPYDPSNNNWRIKNFKISSSSKKVQNFQYIIIDGKINKMIYFDYDLDLCRNYYNGELYVSSWDTLINRTSLLYPNIKTAWEYANDTSDYYLSYIIPTISFNVEKFVNFQIEKSRSRFIKYSNRGFTIIPIDNFEQGILNNIRDYLNLLEKGVNMHTKINILFKKLNRISIPPIFAPQLDC